jgi:hypothetical protein
MRPKNTYLAPAIFPAIPVAKQSDKIFEIDDGQESWANRDVKRLAGGESKMIDWNVNSTQSYFADDHSLSAIVADEEIANADTGATPALDKASLIREALAINREIAAFSAVDAAMTGSLTSTPANKWDDNALGTPITDIIAKISFIEGSSGKKPTAMAMDVSVWRAIANHPDYIDRVKHTLTPMQINTMTVGQILAQILGLENIYLGDLTMKNTAVKGQTPVFSRVWSDNALLFRREDYSLMFAGFGLSFEWRVGIPGAGGFAIRRFRNEERMGDQLVGHWFYDDKIPYTAGSASIPGHWFTDTLT